jgi:uncharacterized membrane protein YkvI
MEEIELLKKEIEEIKARNKRVEMQKAWETSNTRRLSIICLTYIVMVVLLSIIGTPVPLVNAVVPTLGFFLSTVSIGAIKKWWIKKNHLGY